MNIYRQKQVWKYALLLTAIFIGFSSLWYTNKLVKKLSEEEKKKVELWAQGTRQFANLSQDGDISFVFEVIKNNTTVPVILTDSRERIISFRNLDSASAQEPGYLSEQLRIMKARHQPIEITLPDNQKNYIFYKDSLILTKLRYYPYFQLGVIALFLLVSYLAFSSSRKAEQNQVWIGMAKETAHQLGTPLSSLMGWAEFLKSKGMGEEITSEIDKDVHRLHTITERFSKIGSKPVLLPVNFAEVVRNTIQYIRSRTSDKVNFLTEMPAEVIVPLNVPLFEWVIENICKNSVDAMSGAGTVTAKIAEEEDTVMLDISDTGKGISKSRYKTVFKPGFTTKSRGWGLGLSLSKRIVEEYHGGQIFVKQSELNKGSTIRIILRKSSLQGGAKS